MKSKWLVSALGDNQPIARLPRFSPKDFLYKTIAMTEQLRSHYDRYDDSYIELFKSVDDLKKFLDGMKIDVRKYSVQISVTERILKNNCFSLSGYYFDIEGAPSNRN